MPSEPVHKGTLVCVVLKARNLPNKKSIGKQDPYTVLSIGPETQKTKADKRGGQHPTWDEQLHFEIYSDMEDALATDGTAAKKGGKKVLKVACYADDTKEPELIGEGIVDLTDTLSTGEFDEWVTIKAKDRYAGEVYLELTFYSSAAPPKKKPAAKPVLTGSDTYGGAGTFSRIDGADDVSPAASKGKNAGAEHQPIPASMRPASSHNRLSSSVSASSLASISRASFSSSHSATMNDIASSLRRPSSSSLANPDAYTPAYAPQSISRGTSPAPPVASRGPSPAPQHYASRGPSPAPPFAASYHAPSDMGSYGAGSRRNSFVHPSSSSEFGHSAGGSYYSQQSVTPSQSITYLASPNGADSHDDRYATIRAPAYNVPRSQSVSHIPSGSSSYGALYNDPTQQLTQSMSHMSFSHSHSGSSASKPPSEDRPPQSHVYQAPAHLASLYNPPPPQQRPVSPAARPGSALSQYSTSPAAGYPSTTINAHQFYQQQQHQQGVPPSAANHLAQPPVIPPRSTSPAASLAYTPIPSPYAQPYAASRPLPSTQPPPQPSAPAPAPAASGAAAYPSHLYQPQQQPSPPPHHHRATSYSQSSWQGPPPAAAPAANGYYPQSQPPAAYPPQQDWHAPRAPSPLPPIPPQHYPAAPYNAYPNNPAYYPPQQQQPPAPAPAQYYPPQPAQHYQFSPTQQTYMPPQHEYQ